MDPYGATAYLLVGLPGAGKTTRARELEQEHRALRLTPDEWMIPLFGESDADGKRDVLEGRLLSVALRALAVGTNVVLDFGFWGRDERFAVRALARQVGADAEVVYLPIEAALQRARVAERLRGTPEQTFPLSEADLLAFGELFQPPDSGELGGSLPEQPPPPWPSWPAYAIARWPSLKTQP